MHLKLDQCEHFRLTRKVDIGEGEEVLNRLSILHRFQLFALLLCLVLYLEYFALFDTIVCDETLL